MNWYALEVSSSKTTDARDALIDAGFDAYIPWEFRWKRMANRKRYKQAVPIMPGYVFARMHQHEQRKALDTDHVHRFVQFGPAPAIIDTAAMDLVKTLTPEKVDKLITGHGKALKTGMHAEIAEGPYTGHSGEITRMADRRSRILLYVLGSWREVEVKTDDLEPV